MMSHYRKSIGEEISNNASPVFNESCASFLVAGQLIPLSFWPSNSHVIFFSLPF